MMRKVIFPGSFDPFTLGHLDLVHRLSELFDEVIVAIGKNQAKSGLFSVEERKILIEKALKEAQLTNASVISYDGLTMELVHQLGALLHVVFAMRLIISMRKTLLN